MNIVPNIKRHIKDCLVLRERGNLHITNRNKRQKRILSF